MIRSFLTEALKMGEVLQGDGDRALVRQIAYQLVGVEQSLLGLIGMQLTPHGPLRMATPPPPLDEPTKPTPDVRDPEPVYPDGSISTSVPEEIVFPNA